MELSQAISTVATVYNGSSGDATKALYQQLEQLGGRGVVAMNLFRAQKCSERAKMYRRRSHKDAAYGRKDWSIGNLCDALMEHGQADQLLWGWGEDPQQAFHRHVLYVDLPTGQVSFHSGARQRGPDYPGVWDGQRGVSPGRIVQWVARVLSQGQE